MLRVPSHHKNVPGPESLGDPSSDNDAAAVSEAAGFADRNLDEISKVNEHGRREKFLDHMSSGAIVILWVLMGITLFSIIAVGWHYLTPWPWLSEAQLTGLRTYVFSGAVVAAVGGYLRRYID